MSAAAVDDGDAYTNTPMLLRNAAQRRDQGKNLAIAMQALGYRYDG